MLKYPSKIESRDLMFLFIVKLVEHVIFFSQWIECGKCGHEIKYNHCKECSKNSSVIQC